MDDKVGRHNKLSENTRQWQRRIEHFGRRLRRLLLEERSVLCTGVLIVLLLGLLYIVASQLQPPTPTNTTPANETALSYSDFVKQVEVGHVWAVNIRGNEMSALLNQPLLASTLPAAPTTAEVAAEQKSQDIQDWNRYISTGNSPGGKILDTERAVHTQMPVNGDEQLMVLLLSKQVQVRTIPVAQTADWLVYLWRFLPFLIGALVILSYTMMRNRSSLEKTIDERITQMGKNRVRRFERAKEVPRSGHEPREARKEQSRDPINVTGGEAVAKARVARIAEENRVTFADVAGIDEVRSELEEIVEFLRRPERYNRLGARIPRGALLIGPPGTGKTLLARAVAGEAQVPFFSMSASEFVEMFVGVGASRVRDLFNQARQASPSVIFIDEIDAVGRKRSMRMSGNDERDQTLNQLLVELDGFDARHAVVVLAATNRADILDSALLRPGRFDRRIMVSPPDRVGREAILRVHTRNTPLDADVSLERIARITTGMTGADLANLVNEAALSAARRNLPSVPHPCFEEALARVQLGALRPLVMNERERRIIAIHEGGHALVAHYLPEGDVVNRVTILPRGQSLGVTHFMSEEDRYNYSREYLIAKIAIGLGGRVAEELTFGEQHVTTGAENDFQVVTDLARKMVTRWGMSKQLGLVFADYQAGEGAYGLNMRHRADLHSRDLALNAHGEPVLQGGALPPALPMANVESSPATASVGLSLNALVDAEVLSILAEGRAIASHVLTEHHAQLQHLAATLMEEEALDRTQFEALIGAKPHA